MASFEHLRKHARVREKKKKKKKKRENEKKKREGGAFVNIPFSSFSPSYYFSISREVVLRTFIYSLFLVFYNFEALYFWINLSNRGEYIYSKACTYRKRSEFKIVPLV